jgi:hypothetical protein
MIMPDAFLMIGMVKTRLQVFNMQVLMLYLQGIAGVCLRSKLQASVIFRILLDTAFLPMLRNDLHRSREQGTPPELLNFADILLQTGRLSEVY